MKYPTPDSYPKDINTKIDKTLGYVYFIDFDHPLSNKCGKVYHHRHILSIKIGKWVDKSYHVHHIDGNKANNDPSNLEMVSPSKHSRKHLKTGISARKVRCCLKCEKKFISTTEYFCSLHCANLYKGKIVGNITKEELEVIVWQMPTTEIAKIYNCSDSAIGKLCKKLGIPKPPRGYWAKLGSKS